MIIGMIRRIRQLNRMARQAETDYCERSVDEVEWQGDRVHLYLGARRPFQDVVYRGH
jgi:hypothetical protein